MKSFCRLAVVVSALLLAPAGGAAAQPAEPITRIADVRALSREEAAKALPVHVRGVVTWRSVDREQLTLQDDSAGIWIALARARKTPRWTTDDATFNSIRVGHVLEIEGVSDPTGFAPVIFPTTIRMVGEQPLPPARPTDPERFFSGAEDSLRVAVRGVVQGYQPAGGGWVLQLNARPGRFTAEISAAVLPNPDAVVDAEVRRVTGVAVTRFNTRGEITMPRIFSSQAGELVIEVPAAAPFAAPLVPLDQLMPFRPNPTGAHRLRVLGTVSFVLAGKFLYLQEGACAVRVETRSTEPMQAGDRGNRSRGSVR